MNINFDKVINLTDDFSNEVLKNKEISTLCHKLISKISREKPELFEKNDAKLLAATMVEIIAAVNFLFEDNSFIKCSNSDIADFFGVEQDMFVTLAEKLVDEFSIYPFHPDLLLKGLKESNPLQVLIRANYFMTNENALFDHTEDEFDDDIDDDDEEDNEDDVDDENPDELLEEELPEMLSTSGVLIRIKPEFVEYVNSLQNESKYDYNELEKTSFYITDMYFDDEEFDELFEDIYISIFKSELDNLLEDESDWPDTFSKEDFIKYFDIEKCITTYNLSEDYEGEDDDYLWN